MGRDVGYLYRIGERVIYTSTARNTSPRRAVVIEVHERKITLCFADTNKRQAVWKQCVELDPMGEEA